MYQFKLEDAERFAREQGIQVRTRGHELIFQSCPYCRKKSTEKEKFSIHTGTGQFHCFRASCGAKGNMITLAKDFNFSLGSEIDEYYRQGRKFRDISMKKDKPEPKPAAIAYMEARGISEKTCQKYHITTQKEKSNILVFPFYDENGVLQFVKYRKMDFDKTRDKSKEWCEADCKPILFGMDHCNFENDVLILTEGQIDSLSLSEAGIENAVSVPTGAKGFSWVPYCWDFLHKFRTLIVFGDYEGEKITLVEEIQQRFEGMVKHPRESDYKDCKDANEILQKYGKQALVDAVEYAVPVKHPQIISLADVENMDLGSMEKISSGFVSLDRILGGFYFGQLILLTGERGEGKSTLASQIGTLAVKNGYSVFFYSGELMNWYFKAWFDRQIAGRNYINKSISSLGHVDFSIDGQILPQMEAWYRDKVYLYDNNIIEKGNEEGTLLNTLESAIKQYGCRVLFVDNLMTAMEDDVSVDQYRQQTVFVGTLAKMAKKFDVLIFLIAHPRKRITSTFENDDIAGSSNITNLVDVVMRYSRPKGSSIPADTKERELTVHKNRLTGETNRKGIPLFYDPASKRISEIADEFDWKLGWEELKEDVIDDSDDLELPF